MTTGMQGARLDLVIFDCDGVLVDSELLSAGVLMRMLEEVGLPITKEIMRSDFLGRSFAAAAVLAAKRFGRNLPDNFQMRYRDELLAQMKGTLTSMPGVEGVLTRLTIPYCLATSSSPPRLALTLSETGLGAWFEGRTFTASEVKNGKPAPDLFLLAAARFNADPARTLVIEDSDVGLRAGMAAGMQVWHFAGGSHMREGMEHLHAATFHRRIADMAALQAAFSEMGIGGQEQGPRVWTDRDRGEADERK